MRTTANRFALLLLVGLAACNDDKIQPVDVDAGFDAGIPDAGVPDAGAPDGGAPDSGAPDAGIPDAGPKVSRFMQRAYIKASAPGGMDFFGEFLAVSGDGLTFVSTAKADDGTNNTKSNSGAAYVFTRTAGAWTQTALLRASNADVNDEFGKSVTISADGSLIVVGAWHESSAGANPADNSAANAGAAYVFRRGATGWVEEALLKAPAPAAGQQFGVTAVLSADGTTLAIGATGAQAKAGAVHVFHHSAGAWTHQAALAASNAQAGDEFGYGLSISGSGDLIAVGAFNEDSAAKGVGGAQAEGAVDSGAVYVFARVAGAWSQQAYVKASNTGVGDGFGETVALSLDGTTLAVGALYENSKARGVNGVETDESAGEAGAVYVFRAGPPWIQEAYVKASNTDPDDYFGSGLALTSDGNLMVVGAAGEFSNATGVNGDELNNDEFYSGAGYVYARVGGGWAQEAYLKASNSNSDDRFGVCVAMSADAGTLVIGAFGEASASTTSQTDNSAKEAGAAYVF